MFEKVDYGHNYFYGIDHFCGAVKVALLFGFLCYLGDIIYDVKVLERH